MSAITVQLELLAAERKVNQLEKRAKNGICPCCHRQFFSYVGAESEKE
jgi:hypothetical protein